MTHLFRLATSMILLTAFSPGCGQTIDADPAAAPARCRGYAESECSYLARCEPESFRPDCVAVRVEECEDVLSVPDIGTTLTQLDACGAARAATACGLDPAACGARSRGTREAGRLCAVHGQCATGFCRDEPKACGGVCAPPPSEGEPCGANECDDGLFCDRPPLGDQGICARRVAEGGACDIASPYEPCGAGSTCDGGTCRRQVEVGGTCSSATICRDGSCVEGVCVPYARDGETCSTDDSHPACDWLRRSVCHLAPGKKLGRCVTPTPASPGEPCGSIDGDDVICVPGSFCGQAGLCSHIAGIGDPCGDITGETIGCAPNARCDFLPASTTGVCKRRILFGGACGATAQDTCDGGLTCVGGRCDISRIARCE